MQITVYLVAKGVKIDTIDGLMHAWMDGWMDGVNQYRPVELNRHIGMKTGHDFANWRDARVTVVA